MKKPMDEGEKAEAMNERRSEWASRCIDFFCKKSRTDYDDAVCDLLCNLMHFCDRSSFMFVEELRKALYHYEAETLAALQHDEGASSFSAETGKLGAIADAALGREQPTIKVTRTSILTGETTTLELPVTQQQLDAYAMGGATVQEVFSNLPAPLREFIMTGVTPAEWKEEIGAEEEWHEEEEESV